MKSKIILASPFAKEHFLFKDDSVIKQDKEYRKALNFLCGYTMAGCQAIAGLAVLGALSDDQSSGESSSVVSTPESEISQAPDESEVSSSKPSGEEETSSQEEETSNANTANVTLAGDPLNMKLCEIADYNGLYVSLIYVKSQTYLQTALDYYTKEVTEGHQVIYAIFEIYNPGDDAITLNRSEIEGYCDNTKANGVDTYYKIACDDVHQFDSYELYPNTRALAVFDFEVPTSLSEMKFYCGNNAIWKINASEITTGSFNMETTVFPDAPGPEAPSYTPGDVVYSEDYELVYQGTQVYTHDDGFNDPADYVIFKFQLNNTGSEEIDYSLVGYSMRCYGDGLLLDDCSYTMDDKIDEYINLFDVESVKPGMSASFYLPFELAKPATEFYLVYDQGYIVDDVLFEMSASAN